MAPSRLLRYIFRHGPHSSRKTHTLPPSASPASPASPAPVEPPAPSTDEPKSAQTPSPTATTPCTPDRPIAQVFENVVEESPRSLAASIASTSRELNIHSFTTRELLHAAIEEARTATHAHLDTIDTALLVLDALDGFSETINILREEMAGTKTWCEEKLKMLDDVEGAVAQMDGDTEGSDEDATIRARYP